MHRGEAGENNNEKLEAAVDTGVGGQATSQLGDSREPVSKGITSKQQAGWGARGSL
eukprot:COSAG02_NODE_1671_length_11389_cov_24.192826_7_plen_56_part_00